MTSSRVPEGGGGSIQDRRTNFNSRERSGQDVLSENDEGVRVTGKGVKGPVKFEVRGDKGIVGKNKSGPRNLHKHRIVGPRHERDW